MPRKKQPTEKKRRNPRQARAHDTIETIFGAVARILQREGPDALNTNRIAETAGISVGTLYGYFPNKKAILIAMAQRELAKTEGEVLKAITTSSTRQEAGRAAIHAMIKGFGGQTSLRLHLLEAMVANGLYSELARPPANFAQLLMAPNPEGSTVVAMGLTEVQAFVMTRALIGLIRAAVFEDSPLIQTAAFEDELVRLTRGYVWAITTETRSLG